MRGDLYQDNGGFVGLVWVELFHPSQIAHGLEHASGLSMFIRTVGKIVGKADRYLCFTLHVDQTRLSANAFSLGYHQR